MTPPNSFHGVASSGEVGWQHGRGGDSFRGFDERGVEGLSAAVAGGAAGLRLPLRRCVSRATGLCTADLLPCMASLSRLRTPVAASLAATFAHAVLTPLRPVESRPICYTICYSEPLNPL